HRNGDRIHRVTDATADLQLADRRHPDTHYRQPGSKLLWRRERSLVAERSGAWPATGADAARRPFLVSRWELWQWASAVVGRTFGDRGAGSSVAAHGLAAGAVGAGIRRQPLYCERSLYHPLC